MDKNYGLYSVLEDLIHLIANRVNRQENAGEHKVMHILILKAIHNEIDIQKQDRLNSIKLLE